LGAFNDMKLGMALDDLTEAKKLLEFASHFMIAKGCCSVQHDCEWHYRYHNLMGEKAKKPLTVCKVHHSVACGCVKKKNRL
jgi:hypothetical protein